MLLTITNTTPTATDLGYLLHKNPARVHTVDLSFGVATIYYPEASDERCIATVQVEVDSIGLVRNPGNASLDQYVNDRPYCANSFLCVALGKAFGTAMSGRCKDRPELVTTPLNLETNVPVLPCRGGEAMLRKLFEPLGYVVDAQPIALDPNSPEWGNSRYYSVRLQARISVQSLLQHLTVLIPVLDNLKHYWIGDDEVEKLLRRGEAWLSDHPARDLILSRYLGHRRGLIRDALARLLPEEIEDIDQQDEKKQAQEEQLEKALSLNEQRYESVMQILTERGVRRVADLGCSEGKFLNRLFQNTSFDYVAGMDVSPRALKIAARRLRLDEKSERQKERIALFQGSLLYRDDRLSGFDAVCLIEVVEHQDPPRLAAFERTVFECAKPRLVVVTTPNIEYNVLFETLTPGKLRHGDHRFEWTRDEFRTWAAAVADRYGYTWAWQPIGEEDPEVGPPTQMVLFERATGTDE